VNWTTAYLVCFLLGLSLTVCAWVTTMLGVHVPHAHGVPHGPDALHAHAGAHPHADTGPSAFNFATLAAFLAWFGGAGYLLTRFSDVWPPLALLLAAAVGSTGAALVFKFMARVLWSPDENLDPDDFDVVGVLATVSSPIRAGGTGEVLFQQAGTRRVAGARSEDGAPIDRGVEVVITRHDRGLVYVRRWDELAGNQSE
jgi:membrane protein implicated in regulation of membrane protease activity